MITLGIDPGIGRCGYGIIDQQGNRSILVDYGCIETHKDLTLGQRLDIVFEELMTIIQRHQPERIGVEELFFSKNAKTAFQVGQARGVIMLAIQKQGIEPIELTPNQVKQAVTGYGSADKHQIQQMVKMILGLQEIPKPDDAADALAVACAAAVWSSF